MSGTHCTGSFNEPKSKDSSRSYATCYHTDADSPPQCTFNSDNDKLLYIRGLMNKQLKVISDLKMMAAELKEASPKTPQEEQLLSSLDQRIVIEIKQMRQTVDFYMNEMRKQGNAQGEVIPLETTLFEDTVPQFIRVKDVSECAEVHPEKPCREYHPEGECVSAITRIAGKKMSEIQDENKVLLETLRAQKKNKKCSHFNCLEEHRKHRSCGNNSGKKFELKMQYEVLLRDYNKKEAECIQLKEDLEQRMQAERCNEKFDAGDEIDVFRIRADELCLQRTELGIMVDEQTAQIKDYSKKILATADAIKEYQKKLRESEMTRAKIYDQIECHIDKMKHECNEEIKQYVRFPELLQQKREDFNVVSREIECIKEHIKVQLERLKIAREEFAKLRPQKNTLDISREIRDVKHKLDMTNAKYQKLLKENTDLRAILDCKKDEAHKMRSETSYTITRITMRADSSRRLLQEHIDRLENDLAELNAAGAIATVDKDNEISALSEQIRNLSNNFDDAQMHIKSLTSQVSYLGSMGGIPDQSAAANKDCCSQDDCVETEC